MDRNSFQFYCDLCSVGMMTREGYEVHVLGKRHQERMLPPDKRPGAASTSASGGGGSGGSASADEPELVKSDFVFLRRITCEPRELLEPLGSRVLNYADLPGSCCVVLFDQLDTGQWEETYRHLSARGIACPVYIQNGVCGSRQPADKRRLNFVFLYNLPDQLGPADIADGAAGGRISVGDVRIVERLGDARAAFVRVSTDAAGGAAHRSDIVNLLSSSSEGFSVFELWAPAEALESPSPTPPPAPAPPQLQPPVQPMMMVSQPQAHYSHPLLAFQQAQYANPAQYMQYPVSVAPPVAPPYWNAPPPAMFGQQFNYPPPPINAGMMMAQSFGGAYSASAQQAAAATAWQQQQQQQQQQRQQQHLLMQQHRQQPPVPASRWVDSQPDEERNRRRVSRSNAGKRSPSSSPVRSGPQLRNKSKSPGGLERRRTGGRSRSRSDSRRHRRQRTDDQFTSRDESRHRRGTDRLTSRIESQRSRHDDRSDSRRKSSSRHRQHRSRSKSTSSRHGRRGSDANRSKSRSSSSRRRVTESSSRRSDRTSTLKRSTEISNGSRSSPPLRRVKESPDENKSRGEHKKEQTNDSNLFLLGLKMIQQTDSFHRQPAIGAVVSTAAPTVSTTSDSWYISSGLETYYVVSGFPKNTDCLWLSTRLQAIFQDCYASCYAAVHPSTGSKAAVIAPLPGKSLSKSRLMEVTQFLARSGAKKFKSHSNDEQSPDAEGEFEVVWEKELPVMIDSDATDSDCEGIPDADAEFRVESEAESTESSETTDVITIQTVAAVSESAEATNVDANPKSVRATTETGNPVELHVQDTIEGTNLDSVVEAVEMNSATKTTSIIESDVKASNSSPAVIADSMDEGEAIVEEAGLVGDSVEVKGLEKAPAEADALVSVQENSELADLMETADKALSAADPNLSTVHLADASERDVTTDPIDALFEPVDERISVSSVFDEVNFAEDVGATNTKPNEANYSVDNADEAMLQAVGTEIVETSNSIAEITEPAAEPISNTTNESKAMEQRVSSNEIERSVESKQSDTQAATESTDLVAINADLEGVEATNASMEVVGEIDTVDDTEAPSDALSDANQEASVDIIVQEVAETLLDAVDRMIESDSAAHDGREAIQEEQSNDISVKREELTTQEIEKPSAAAEPAVVASVQATCKPPAHDSTVSSLCLREYSTVTCHEFASSLPDRFLFWPTKGQAPFLLLWNLPTQLALSQLISVLRELIPRLRSVHVPRDPLQPQHNCGYCVVRFQCESEDAFGRCLAARDKVRTFGRDNRRRLGRHVWQTKLRAIPAQMREICHVPPFSFPCHNLISWVASVDPSTERCVLDRSPFACPCHPVCEELAPDSQKFVQFAELVQQARAVHPVETVRANLRSYLDSISYR